MAVRKVRGSTKTTRKSPQQVQQVLKRRARGETTRQIARAEKMNQNTVIRILSLPENQEIVQQGRQVILNRCTQMAQRLVELGMGERRKGDRQALIAGLAGIGILTPRQEVKLEEDIGGFFEGKSYHEALFFVLNSRWAEPEELAVFAGKFPLPGQVADA